VCRLEACRIECRTARDCQPGLDCVLDADGLGACQLLGETSCTLASDCPAPLVCANHACVNVCNEDRDCPAGARCVDDLASGGRACLDDSTDVCVQTSDCNRQDAGARVCTIDMRCRDECRTDRDCRYGTVCLNASSVDRPEDVWVCDFGDAAAPFDSAGIDAGMPPVASFKEGAAGFYHTCAIEGSEVWCWGNDSSGQLGDGVILMPPTVTAPLAPVPMVTDASFIAGGGEHTCIIRSTGQLWCWGRNNSVQLGIAGIPSSASPIMVGLPAAAQKIAAGAVHTCAILTTGEPWCWGDNGNGQLGRGTIGGMLVPGPITGVAAATDIAVGAAHTCFTGGGTLFCVGDNFNGQLGDGTTTDRPSPVRVPGVTNPIEIGLATQHTCAIDAVGAAYCWGSNNFGQIGNGTVGGTQLRPIPVRGLPVGSTVAQIGGGNGHTCALLGSGEVWCWGSAIFGQIGVMMRSPSPVPVRVGLPGAATQLTVGQEHACAVLASGDLACWGANSSGQLGDGTVIANAMPRVVVLPP